MGVLKYRAEYPIIHQAPGFGLIFRNMNFGDYTRWAALTAVAFPIGYTAGNFSRQTRMPFMWFTVAVASSAGLAAGLLRSSGRLLGLTSNQAEASQYKYRLDYTDYQVRTEPFRNLTEEEREEIQDNPRY